MFIIVYNGVGVWQVLLELPIRIIAISLFRGKWFNGCSKLNHSGVYIDGLKKATTKQLQFIKKRVWCVSIQSTCNIANV